MAEQERDNPGLDNPFFARIWTFMSNHETDLLRGLRRETLGGLTGRVLEVGAGTGTNFQFYPETVNEVVALEPEPHLATKARAAAADASVSVTVLPATIETMADGQPFDAAVCSLVLCSVDDPEAVLRKVHSVLKPGGELRYLEHVASSGIRGKLQQVADATVWPLLVGNCHTHRDTESAVTAAGFAIDRSRRQAQFPAWVPTPVMEVALGRAVKPA